MQHQYAVRRCRLRHDGGGKGQHQPGEQARTKTRLPREQSLDVEPADDHIHLILEATHTPVSVAAICSSGRYVATSQSIADAHRVGLNTAGDSGVLKAVRLRPLNLRAECDQTTVLAPVIQQWNARADGSNLYAVE
jgi:hypothetical protein